MRLSSGWRHDPNGININQGGERSHFDRTEQVAGFVGAPPHFGVERKRREVSGSAYRYDGSNRLNPGGGLLAEQAFGRDEGAEESKGRPDDYYGGEGEGGVAVSVHARDAGTTVAVRQ